jgi:hypothetical protein
MAGKWCDAGENRIAAIIFGATAVESYYMGIYKSPTTEPGETAVMADLTEAGTPGSGGYARIQLARGSWSTSGSVASYAQQTFLAAGASWGACYGYFLTTTSAGTAGPLMAVEQFSDGPYTINDGDSIKITPSITIA